MRAAHFPHFIETLQRSTVVLLIALIALPVSFSTAKTQNTPWTPVGGGEVRLINVGPPSETGAYQLGVEILLEPGWHTYWRFPGEAGVPTEMEFQGSSNLKAAEVSFPAPERYDDGFSTSIVYHDHVVLPLEIRATDQNAPVGLAATLHFGVCKDVCIPAEARFDLQLSPTAPPNPEVQREIDEAKAHVPKLQDATSTPRIKHVAVLKPGKDAILQITTESALENAPVDLFAEGPAGSYIGVPQKKSEQKSETTFELPVRGLALKDGAASVLLVAVSGEGATKTTYNFKENK